MSDKPDTSGDDAPPATPSEADDSNTADADRGSGVEPEGANAEGQPDSDDGSGGEAVSAEVQRARTVALLCYVISIVSILPIITRDNEYTLYHAKQGLFLFILLLAGSFLFPVLATALSVVGLGFVVTLISPAYWIALIVLVVIGAMNAWKGLRSPLPVIGPFAEKLFRGITKV